MSAEAVAHAGGAGLTSTSTRPVINNQTPYSGSTTGQTTPPTLQIYRPAPERLTLQTRRPITSHPLCKSVTYLRLKPLCISVTRALAPVLEIHRPSPCAHGTMVSITTVSDWEIRDCSCFLCQEN